MRRSAYALIAGTGMTSLLGLVFWVLAAHWLPAAMVGIGAALISALTLVANFSTLGLRNGLVRFLPEAGTATRRLVASSYALCAAAAMAVATVFLLGQPWWADELGFLRDSPLAAVVFVVAAAIWVLFILQDHVLTGLHKTVWVPITNAICSVSKIALLPLLAFSAAWAIFAASVLPAAVMVAVVTVLILRRAPRPTANAGPPAIPMARLVRFAATDHVAALVWLGTADVLTLMVLQELGPEASAYYFMANTIAYGLFLVTSNISSALVAEGARSPDRVVALTRAALRNSALLVLPAAGARRAAGAPRAQPVRQRLRRPGRSAAAAAAALCRPADRDRGRAGGGPPSPRPADHRPHLHRDWRPSPTAGPGCWCNPSAWSASEWPAWSARSPSPSSCC